MNKSQSVKELATALNKVQASMMFAPMDSTNPFLKNKYADLGSIIKTAKPLLATNGLSISQHVEGMGDQIGVVTLLMHSSGEWLESAAFLPIGEERGKSLAQVAGSVITYLRRYAYASILGMYADEDTDGTAAKSNGHKEQTAPFTVEEACNVVNREGAKYGDLPTEKLNYMLNAVSKKSNLDDDQLLKVEAMKLILSARADGTLKEPAGIVATAHDLGGQPA